MERQMLKDKVAIITGASYGMGQTMAELFAEEGAAVVITARGKEKLDAVVQGIRQKGGKAVGVVADVCSTEDTRRVFETAVKEFGDVDILINNAGIGEQKMIDETDDEWMRFVMDTNLGGPMRYIREALKIFLPKNDGVIISVGTVNGQERFDGATHPHSHFVCDRCGSVLDIEGGPGGEACSDISRRYGVNAVRCDVVFRGICAACKKSEKIS